MTVSVEAPLSNISISPYTHTANDITYDFRSEVNVGKNVDNSIPYDFELNFARNALTCDNKILQPYRGRLPHKPVGYDVIRSFWSTVNL